jgi:DNA-binding transcriptional ArsR family regulator
VELLQGLKALANDTRLKLLALLEHDELCGEALCGEALAKQLELTPATVSQHLKTLREAGLVKGEKKGYYVHYGLEKEALAQLAERLKNISEEVEVSVECSDDEHPHPHGPGDCCREYGEADQ